MKYNFTVLLVLIYAIGIAQTVEIPKNTITIRGYYGFISPHHQGLSNLITGHIPCLEIDISKQTNGDWYWHHNLNHPYSGISLNFGFLGNKQQLGSYYAFSPHISFPLINKKTKFYLRLNGGAAYVTKPFDPITNYKNELIGSHLNGYLRFLGDFSFPISSLFDLRAGISFTHISNGSYKKPNLGVNMPSLSLGTTYHINKQTNCEKPKKIQVDTTILNIIIGFDAGARTYNVLDKEYPAYNFYTMAWLNLSDLSSIGLSSDFFYNTFLYDVYYDKTGNRATFNNILQHAMALGYKLAIHKTELYAQIGVYTYSKHQLQGPLYEKIGAYYWLNNKFYLNCNLKAHKGVADFIEFGLGYKIWKK